MFTLIKQTKLGRRGILTLKQGVIQTPFFMPVGTVGAMKGLTFTDILDIGAEILLCNTYHMHLRPGDETVAAAGGLHNFIGWNKPILTDSGGFQVFSFSRNGRCAINDDGVEFKSHLNGAALKMGPIDSMRIQHNLGANIIMCFDECPPSTASRTDIKRAVERTLRWAQICKNENETFKAKHGYAPLLFGIVQGGLERDIREFCAEALINIGFDGYAIGGLAVGEGSNEMIDVVKAVCPLLPSEALRYLMGVGVISQMRECIALGIDMFDCVLPMRIARHGRIILSDESEIRIVHSRYKEDFSPLDSNSPSALSHTHSKAYVNHLLKSHERFGEVIATKQNMAVTLHAIKNIQVAMDAEINIG